MRWGKEKWENRKGNKMLFIALTGLSLKNFIGTTTVSGATFLKQKKLK